MQLSEITSVYLVYIIHPYIIILSLFTLSYQSQSAFSKDFCYLLQEYLRLNTCVLHYHAIILYLYTYLFYYFKENDIQTLYLISDNKNINKKMSLYNVHFIDKLILYPLMNCSLRNRLFKLFFFNQLFTHNEHGFAWNLIYH